MKKIVEVRWSRGGEWPVRWLALMVCGFLLCGVLGATDQAAAEDLDELLSQVGEEYAVAYASPFLYSFGPNANSNMFATAHIPWTGITFGFGIKVMGTKPHESDQTFSKVIRNVDLSDYDSSVPSNTLGNILMSGPTIFGDDTVDGQIEGFVNGISVFKSSTIPGLVESDWSPLVAPELNIGGLSGLKLTVRYLPEVDAGDYGKTKYWGYGLQWNVNGVLKTLPVDVLVGFFTQEINVGSVFESKASTFFVGASKDYSVLTAYGGFALEDSELDVSYEFDDPGNAGATSEVGFHVDGIQDTRMTLGVSLNVLAKLNFELGLGSEMTTYSAGLMFGL